jgi:carbon-monoxide dehydrogenase small subunit
MSDPPDQRISIRVTVNGVDHRDEVLARQSLADWLRESLGLTGTHLGCEQGVCGACTVLLDRQAIRSCLMFAVQANGRSLTTIEGVGQGPEQLHPLQRAFARHHALQCGFCTAGFIMTCLPSLAELGTKTRPELREYLSGNICRCTGYVKILDAIADAAREVRDGAGVAHKPDNGDDAESGRSSPPLDEGQAHR